jgi:hypothetical protein
MDTGANLRDTRDHRVVREVDEVAEQRDVVEPGATLDQDLLGSAGELSPHDAILGRGE